MSEATGDALLTKDEVAQRLRVSLRQVHRYIADGDLPVVRLGRVRRSVRIRERDLQRFVARPG